MKEQDIDSPKKLSQEKPDRPNQIFGYPGDGKFIVVHGKFRDYRYLILENIDNYWVWATTLEVKDPPNYSYLWLT